MVEKIKVMHVINNLEVGGAEKMLVLLLKELSKRDDIQLYLVSLEGHGILIDDIPKNVIVKNFRYNLFRRIWKLSFFDLNIKLKLLHYVKKVKPDIIHGHLYKGEDIAKMTGFLLNIPVVTTCHDTLIWPGTKARALNFRIAAATAVSNIVADHLEKAYQIPVDKIKIIPNAIDAEMFKEGEKKFDINNPVFIYIGRILRLKGIDDAIKGLAELKKYYPSLKFLIYGKAVHDSDLKFLQDLISKNKYDFVEFMGRTDNVPSALKTGDIFVLPSRSEGFAISVLEAAAARKPVIATRVGAIPEIVEEGESGILVDSHSSKQIFKAAKYILDNNLVSKFGDAAQKSAAKKYDKAKVAQMYMDIYLDIMKRKRSF